MVESDYEQFAVLSNQLFRDLFCDVFSGQPIASERHALGILLHLPGVRRFRLCHQLEQRRGDFQERTSLDQFGGHTLRWILSSLYDRISHRLLFLDGLANAIGLLARFLPSSHHGEQISQQNGSGWIYQDGHGSLSGRVGLESGIN